MSAWRPLAGLIRSLSALVGRDPSQFCRPRFCIPRPTPVSCPPTRRLEVGARMLADQLDYIVGVDPHRDSHSLAVVQVVSGVVVFESTIDASSDGYAQALRLGGRVRVRSASLRGRRNRLVRCWSDALPDRSRRAGARGRQAAAGAPLGRQERRARRGPCRPQRARQQRPAIPRAGGERQACRRLSLHARVRSTRSVPGSASCETC